jgi:hypothetical protein
MTSTIITKNSSTASSVPSSGSLTQGELAVNVTDKKLYTKDSGGTVVKLVGSLGNQEASAAAITGGSINGTTVGASTASTGAFTTLSASSTVSGTGFSTYLASPPAIGGTAAAAGSFTTLAASGAVTLSGGTANGVAYLNGSKVVTSGSALTFNGTGLGIGVSSASNPLHIDFDGTAARIVRGSAVGFLYNTGTASTDSFRIQSNAGPVDIYTASGQPITFSASASEQMRLTSTGLGIGTSSPAFKLQVVGASQIQTNAAGTQQVLQLNNSDTTAGTQAVKLGFSSAGSTKASINAAVYGNDYMTFNVGSDTERLRLDSSGNLGLGVTPSAWASDRRTYQVGRGGALTSGTGAGFVTLSSNTYYDGTNYRYIATDFSVLYGQTTGQHQWLTAPSGTAGNAITFTQAMTLDASGNLALGTTSAGDRLTVSGGRIRMDQDYQIVWQNAGTNRARIYGDSGNNILFENGSGNTERARIDSSGNLLVGTTSDSGGRVNITYTGGSDLFGIRLNTSASGTSTAIQFVNSNAGPAQVGGITTTTTATAYNTSSDYRLKNTIAPMTGALAKVALLKPCTYKWNKDNSDGEGFIAHELAEVVPQCVTGEKDAVDEDGNPKYQGIDTSFLVATLTAALQEAVAEINSLKARLDAANL